VLRANVAAFAALGAPVAAVVKCDGYGWGARRLARELDGGVESYVVSDLDELTALRPATAKPVRLLADAPAGRLGTVLDLDGIPNVSTRAALDEAAAEAGRRGGLTVRVGVVDAAGWAAVRPAEVGAFATAFAGRGLAVELWTHLASDARAGALLDALLAARDAFAAAGVRVVSLDAAGTASARRGLAFDRLRIGAGLFGARLGASVDNSCALRVTAPLVRRYPPGAIGWAGYGDVPVPANRSVAVLRCGYGDGFPKKMVDGVDILSVGMQYTTRVVREGSDPRILVGADDDVDRLAERAGIGAHELLLGLAAR
jgi:alanine racemase